MEIFIGNLAKEANIATLKKVAKSALKRNIFHHMLNIFSKKGNIDDAVFSMVQKKHNGKIIRYCHVEVPSEQMGKLLIESLNGMRLNGGILEVREYMHRAYSNDRRKLNWRNRPWDKVERRKSERRGAEEYFWGLGEKDKN